MSTSTQLYPRSVPLAMVEKMMVVRKWALELGFLDAAGTGGDARSHFANMMNANKPG